jgi:hypothetical protein
MATSLEAAQEKLIRKMRGNAGAKWDAAKPRMAANFADGLQSIGVSVGPLTRQAYQEGINATSGSEVANRAANGAQKWAANFRASMAR